MLYKLRILSDDFSNKMIGELSSVLQQAVILLQSSISELQTILAEISNGNDSLRVILKVIKNLWEKYNKLKNDARNLQDNIEFQTSDLVKNFTDNIESEITRVGWNINRAIEKVTNQIFSSIDSSNEVGFRFRAFVKIIVYEFAYMEIELVKSEGSMGKCSKFKKVYELMSDVKATRVVCHIPFIPGPSANLVRIRLGYFLLYEHHSYLSLAIGSGDKFVAHIHAHVYILGMQVSGDLLISNNGIYIHIEGNIWNIFLAKIEMSAELGKKWFELTFRLKGSFLASSQEPVHDNTHGFQGSYLNGIRSIAKQIGESASDRLQAAQYSLSAAQRVLVSANERIAETQKKLKQCNAKFDSAIYSLESAKRKLDEVKAPYYRALEKLRKAQRNVNNLCRIRSCTSICIPGVKCGCGWIPCCSWTRCMTRVPDLSCEAANVVCSAVRAVAYTALEAVKIFVRIPMVAFDVAKAVLTGAQVVVDKARIVLDVAVALLEVAKTGLEMAEVGLEIAKGAIELLKVTLSAALHVFDYLVLGIQQIIDVKNCGFEIEMSIKDKAFFEMSCEVKAFGLDWKTFRFWFDFRHPVTSMWRVAKGTVSSLLDSITDIFGRRKRRDISFKVMSKLHHIFKLFKRDASDYAGNKSEHLSNTIFKTLYNHSNSNPLNEYNNRVLLFQENCLSFRNVFSFLSNASIQLLNLSNKTVSQLNISLFSDPTLNITTESLIYNLTIESSGISAEYALKDYNLTYEDLNAILDEVKNNFTDDPLIAEINEVKNVAKEMTQSGINEANALAVVQFWIYELENTTKDYFNTTDCAHFRDCVLHSMSLLYGLFIDDSIENAVLNRQLTSSIEDILQPLLTNDSVPVTQTYQMSLKLLEHLTSMNNSNMFCSTPPTFVFQPQNQTVLSGSQIYLYCNVLGDPSPNIYWYLNDSLMENETREELKIEESTKQNTGTYRCIAENVVTNITSGDALILVKECPPGTFYDVSSCQVCSKGSYQRSWNKNECNACPTGFTTSTKMSPSEMECVDINECTDQLSVCQQVCINTNGSYYCQCGRNYNLGKDGKTCSENYTSIFISVGITAGILSLALAMSIKIWRTRHVRKMKIRTHGVRVKSSKQENVYDADPTNAKRSKLNK
ncbi:Hypothetical predicted protein [Mytilus galloprovincialis]|uniref:Ig-like domain-containing protein n=2 Tax=Mytilus galloprovincialis TaxID=29158 RepID=A0A8B6DWW9_MYTGA|nr:Hypothetical predicted protein [Mytilus galloprovincialis]